MTEQIEAEPPQPPPPVPEITEIGRENGRTAVFQRKLRNEPTTHTTHARAHNCLLTFVNTMCAIVGAIVTEPSHKQEHVDHHYDRNHHDHDILGPQTTTAMTTPPI